MTFILSCALLLASLFTSPSYAQCPHEGFDSKQDFELEKFFPGDYYGINQLPNLFQPENQFFCVRARYTFNDNPSLICRLFGWISTCDDDNVVQVLNTGRANAVDGRAVSINFEAIVRDTAKAFVGPGFLPTFLRSGTNYWVVAAGTYKELLGTLDDSDVYQWAVVVTGPVDTTNAETGLCYTTDGTWILARDPVLPDGVLEAIEAIANGIGVDTALLKPVQHEGCQDYDATAGPLGFLLVGWDFLRSTFF